MSSSTEKASFKTLNSSKSISLISANTTISTNCFATPPPIIFPWYFKSHHKYIYTDLNLYIHNYIIVN
ncbi:hypothetical protein LOK49_Contig11G00027 [Camellia lanceoleosa]|nr:hypothetical protein LOK49_Contig11G00027 [Camellia lanceoleosa]